MDVVRQGEDVEVFVVFASGLAKRTPVEQYRVQGRGGLGIKVAKMSDKGGDIVGALLVHDDDEVLVVMEKGKIVRSRVDGVRSTGRDTQGVRFAMPDKGDSIIGIARNVEREVEEEADAAADGTDEGVSPGDGVTSDGEAAAPAAGDDAEGAPGGEQ
ncbi:MAG TPA: DNA gyrase C-terminal beta-propeller domain-containing protein, partial [Angustibacter sp.]|nr:DNA gyrase C-terminal beta-propeller domain-containing protein [Angustibacter sp.]